MRYAMVLGMVMGSLVFAMGPDPSIFTSEATLAADYKERVEPFWATGAPGKLTARDGTQLAYRTFEKSDERAAIVFVTGWTETAQKYAELLYTLSAAGYSLYTMDNRGMGLSQRLAPNPQMVHVEHFDDYVSDLKQFVDTVVRRKAHKRLFLVTHSMGGLVGARYALAYPTDADAIVNSSPLYQIETGNVPEGLAYGLAKIAVQTGRGKHYLPTHHDTTPEAESDYAKQTATHSHPRWDRKVLLWKQLPESFMSGSSNRWFQTTVDATRALRHGEAKRLTPPMLVFSAAQDTRVVNAGVAKVCEMAKQCERRVYDVAYHELFLESDAVRNDAIRRTLEFLERHL